MAKGNTITDAMNIEDGWAKKIHDILNEGAGKTEKVSNLLEHVGEIVREDELGSIQSPLTKYEKKLILAGYFAGHNIGERKSNGREILGAILGGSIMGMEEEDGEQG